MWKRLQNIFITLILLLPGVSCFGAAIQVDLILNGLYDTAGRPLNNGRVYFYGAGGSTPKQVWQDKDKVTGETSVILDSYGSALVYAEGWYKLVVKNSSDTTIRTLDNLYYALPAGSSGVITGAGSANEYTYFTGGHTVDGLSIVPHSVVCTDLNGLLYPCPNLSWAETAGTGSNYFILEGNNTASGNNTFSGTNGFTGINNFARTCTLGVSCLGDLQKGANPVMTVPTVYIYTSGTDTLEIDQGISLVHVRMVGGGGVGGGAASASGATGTTGGNTTFGLATAAGGVGGVSGYNSGMGGAGGTGTPSGTYSFGMTAKGSGKSHYTGGTGGNSPFGGAGGGNWKDNGDDATANSGSGGGGAGSDDQDDPGGGGGSGAYLELWYVNPAPDNVKSFSYSVGTGGAGGVGVHGTGGAGGSGIIIVEIYP